jgi:uncharacterized protein (TIGR02145 family)
MTILKSGNKILSMGGKVLRWVPPLPIEFINVKYGYLYNGYTIQGTNGESITSNDEWIIPERDNINFEGEIIAGDYNKSFKKLIDFINNDSSKLKSTEGWYNTSNGTDDYGFNLYPSGQRTSWSGEFQHNMVYAYLHLDQTNYTNNIEVRHSNNDFYYPNYSATNGISIRLLKYPTNLTHGETGVYTGNDGKNYKTICIGDQEWLSVNLMETKFRNNNWIEGYNNGIYTNISNQDWINLTIPALCLFKDDINAFENETTPIYLE